MVPWGPFLFISNLLTYVELYGIIILLRTLKYMISYATLAGFIPIKVASEVINVMMNDVLLKNAWVPRRRKGRKDLFYEY